jgi:hypothetical protein
LENRVGRSSCDRWIRQLSSFYDVAPDGRRFLMVKNARPAPVSQPDQLKIVVNWVEELKARVPTK